MSIESFGRQLPVRVTGGIPMELVHELAEQQLTNIRSRGRLCPCIDTNQRSQEYQESPAFFRHASAVLISFAASPSIDAPHHYAPAGRANHSPIAVHGGRAALPLVGGALSGGQGSPSKGSQRLYVCGAGGAGICNLSYHLQQVMVLCGRPVISDCCG